MKRLIFVFILTMLCFCSHPEKVYINVFNTFCHSIQNIDSETIKTLSTESTNAMITTCLKYGIHPVSAISGTNVVFRTSKIQYNFSVVKDSLSQDGLSARIWFKINDNDKLYIVDMKRSDDQWKVDLPLIGS